jgi:hypothetical protein
MYAWPAREELQAKGIVEGSLGAAMIVAAVWLGADLLWLAIPLVGLLAATKWPVRWLEQRVAEAAPAAARVIPASRLLIVLRSTPEPLLFTVVGFFVASMLPLMLGFFGVVSLAGGVLGFAQARAVARVESEHGARVLRTGGFAKPDYYHLAH